MKSGNYKLGLLLNFNVVKQKEEFKRVVNGLQFLLSGLCEKLCLLFAVNFFTAGEGKGKYAKSTKHETGYNALAAFAKNFVFPSRIIFFYRKGFGRITFSPAL